MSASLLITPDQKLYPLYPSVSLTDAIENIWVPGPHRSCDPRHADTTYFFSESFKLALHTPISFLLSTHLPSPNCFTCVAHLFFLHLTLTFLVPLGRMLVIPPFISTRQGEAIQLEKHPSLLFPLLRLGERHCCPQPLAVSQGLTACVLWLLSCVLLSGFDFCMCGSWGLKLGWRPKY